MLGQNFTCALQAYPVASVENPSPILPPNSAEEDFQFIRDLNWGAEYANSLLHFKDSLRFVVVSSPAL
jgi:hypothetical protein